MATPPAGVARPAGARAELRVGSAADRASALAAFAAIARRYWIEVWPTLHKLLGHWRVLADAIPDERLRQAALHAQNAKRDNLEGAVAFAAIAPNQDRLLGTRAMASYQAAFDYLDSLCELPNPDPITNATQLNRALLAAVQPGAPHADYYAHDGARADGGYLHALLDSCRCALPQLPAYDVVKDRLTRTCARAATYQSVNHGDAAGTHNAFDQWAIAETKRYSTRRETPPLRWWEIGAAGGSSLPTLALIGAAADKRTDTTHAAAIERAYYPWIAAVNSLLDSLIDQDEDQGPGQHRLLGYYASAEHAGNRLQLISSHALCRAQELTPRHAHPLILAAMTSLYLSSTQAHAPHLRSLRRQLRQCAGPFEALTMLVMRTRRSASWVANRRAHSTMART